MQVAAVSTKNQTDAEKPLMTRLAYQLAGHLLFILGVIGMLLPVLPTTIFWIGAAACYLKSSPAHYQALVSRSRYGKTIENYLQHGVIETRAKKAAVTGMTISAMIMLLIPVGATAKLFSLLGISIAAIYVWSRPEHVAATDDE